MKLKNLKTNFIGKNTFYYKTIDSTQSEIFRRIDKSLINSNRSDLLVNIENRQIKDGTLILADIQTAGLGTHGRKWYTDEGENIAFSFFCEMNCNVDKISGLTIKIAEILLEVFNKKYNIQLEIKEPNDLYYNGKKLGGILTETKIFSNKVKYIVVGIGINTNKKNFADDIKDIATSINKEFGVRIDTKDFITEFCNRFEGEILRIRGGV